MKGDYMGCGKGGKEVRAKGTNGPVVKPGPAYAGHMANGQPPKGERPHRKFMK